MYVLPQLPVSLPTTPLPDNVDLGALASTFSPILKNLSEIHFTKKAVWRDLFALTGTLRTFYTASSIYSAWVAACRLPKPISFAVNANGRIVRIGNASWVELPFTFETEGIPNTTCSGFVSVILEDAGWKIWCLRTILEQLKGVNNVDLLRPVREGLEVANGDGAERMREANGVHGLHNGIGGTGAQGAKHTNGLNGINGTPAIGDPGLNFDSIVIGGGQAGLAVGGRLQALGVSYVILDKQAKVGDSWRTRYTSTKLHTIREYAHLPFDRTFPKSYPEFLTASDLAQGYQDWVSKYGINIWQSTTLQSGSWNANEQIWNLKVDCRGQELLLSCRYVVFAAGAGCQVPLIPTYENREVFKGATLHSQEYKSASEWAGKHGVVVGTANTAHDVAEDMVRANLASVTMIQRSKTYVFPENYYNEAQYRVYNAEIPTEAADRNYQSNPLAISRLLAHSTLHGRARQEPERFDALEKAGFKLDRYGDIMQNLYERAGGHYIDVGASAKIVKGLIKVKSDSLPVSYAKDGLMFSNGDHLKADVIVFATGFLGNLRLVVADLFGDEVADQVEDFWGLDEEGELRGAFKPSGHPAFWYHGGTIGHARYFSRFIALQIKAKLLGTPLHVYPKTG